MLSTESYSNSHDAVQANKADSIKKRGSFISKAVLRENLRRFWPMSLVAAIIMLASGPLVVLFASNVSGDSPDAKNLLLMAISHNANVGFFGFELVFPIITAIALFKYLHSAGGVAVVHALPLSRDTLFRSNVLSGLILIFAPIVLTFLTLLPFMNTGFRGLYYFFNSGPDSSGFSMFADSIKRAPDFGDAVGWLIIASIIVIFVFAVSILSVVITGNSGVGFISASLLNFTVPILFLLTVSNLEHFLYGYSAGSDTYSIASTFQPLTYSLVHYGAFSVLTLVIYVLISAIVFVCAMILYRAFRSERAGDTIVFKSIEYALTWLVTFIGMIAGGFLFEAITYEVNYIPMRVGSVPVNFYIGALLGAALTFIVVTMVVNRSPKALGMRALKSFGCFAVIAVVFFVFVSTNVTGFETRIPQASDVKTASISVQELRIIPYLSGYVIMDEYGVYDDKWGRVISKDPQLIAALTDFHREIVEKASDSKYKDLFEEPNLEETDGMPDTDNAPDSWFPENEYGTYPISYDLGGRYNIDRSYKLTTKFINSSETFPALFESKSYKKAFMLSSFMPYKTMATARLSYPEFGSTLSDGETPYNKTLSSEEVVSLAKCMDEDFMELSYKDLRPTNDFLLTFTILTNNPNPVMSNYGSEISYSITDKYVKTIAWLRQHGYYDEMIAATALLKADFEKSMKGEIY